MTTTTTVKQLCESFFVEHLEDLEVVLFQLFAKLDVDNATGQNLKNIAELVGAKYFSNDAELSRAFIKGTIAVNNGSGNFNDITSAWQLLTGSDSYTKTCYPAAIELYCSTEYSSTIASAMLELMRKAVAAGIEIISIIHFTDDAAIYDVDLYDTVVHTPGLKTYAKVLAS
ncbi:hypothetical protein OAD88_07020, partial [Flavobacteriaceae bacterium]|nr:hypothetical protein [Flavobacteriaceae bacterium]